MKIELEKKILDLARKPGNVNRQIIQSVAEKGCVATELSTAYYSIRDELKELLGCSLPLSIRDLEVVKILRRVREGNYFYLDRKDSEIINYLRNLSTEQRNKLCELLEIDKEQIDSGVDHDLYYKFQAEVFEHIDPEDYYERKHEFSTIIVSKFLPSKINRYYNEIRECYLFGNMYAAIGLCRVLIEIVFREMYIKYGFGKKFDSPKVRDIYAPTVLSIIRSVCKHTKAQQLGNEAAQLYGVASDILHGRDVQYDPCLFIRRTFTLIEQLYDLQG